MYHYCMATLQILFRKIFSLIKHELRLINEHGQLRRAAFKFYLLLIGSLIYLANSNLSRIMAFFRQFYPR